MQALLMKILQRVLIACREALETCIKHLTDTENAMNLIDVVLDNNIYVLELQSKKASSHWIKINPLPHNDDF